MKTNGLRVVIFVKKQMANSVIQHLFPNGNFILGHLHHSADRLHSMSLVMEHLINESDTLKRKELIARSSTIHQDTLKESRALFETLSKNLITPFDREDIFALGTGIKLLSSKTDSLIRYIEQNQCGADQKGLLELATVFQKGTSVLLQVIHGLEKMRQQKSTFEFILDLREIHHLLDELCEVHMAESFDQLDSIKEILINIDIYEYFGTLSAKLKELGQIAEGFIVKYA
jgi:uncharacterized protein Yka (UPF0111/DUF47 family)